VNIYIKLQTGKRNGLFFKRFDIITNDQKNILATN